MNKGEWKITGFWVSAAARPRLYREIKHVMIKLIKICTYLLNQQIKQLEIAFVKQGGLRERMTRARIDERNKKR